MTLDARRAGVGRSNATEGARLVRGSHIVTRRLYGHDKCYCFQGNDGRIIFAIPYETDLALIGRIGATQEDPDEKPLCTLEERDYLPDFATGYFKRDLSAADVVWTCSGVRPLMTTGHGRRRPGAPSRARDSRARVR